MDVLHELTEMGTQLQAAGLVAGVPGGSSDLLELRVLNGRLPSDDDIAVYREMGTAYFYHGKWGFDYSHSTGGPGPHNVLYWVDTPEELTAFIIRFFLSEPCPIEGWVVPLQRHPEWSEPQLQQALLQAPQLSSDLWEVIYRQAYQRRMYLNKQRSEADIYAAEWMTLDRWFSCLFVPLEPVDADAGECLWLRRDLAEAYRVRTRCSRCGSATVVRQEWGSVPRAEAHYRCTSCHGTFINPAPRQG